MKAQVFASSRERGARARKGLGATPFRVKGRRSEGPRAFALVESREGTMGEEVPTPSHSGRKRSAGGGTDEKGSPENPA